MYENIIYILLLFIVITFAFIVIMMLKGYLLYLKSGGRKKIRDSIKNIEKKEDYTGIEHISPILLFITLALEDHLFFAHEGINLKMIRAAFKMNLRARRIIMGGSTITQQLAKNLLFDFKKSYVRKIAELFAVRVIEKEYSKEKILEVYLNCIEFGNGNWNIKAACNYYIHTSPLDVELNEMISLISILPSPKNYDPVNNKDKLFLSKTNSVNNLERKKYIRVQDAEKIRKSGLFENIISDKQTESFYKEIYLNALRYASANKCGLKVDIDSQMAKKICNGSFSSKGLAEYVKACHKDLHTAYMWGGMMDYITEDFIKVITRRYPSWYAKKEKYSSLVNRDVYGCDCSGLIKSYLFGGINHPDYDDLYDLNSSMLLSVSDIKGKIDSLPDVEGICLHMPGHVGVYIGNGQVIECTDSVDFGNGVVKTYVCDRPWTDWFYCPFIKYGE